MKTYLGIRDTASVYEETPNSVGDEIFGINPAERSHVRIRVTGTELCQ